MAIRRNTRSVVRSDFLLSQRALPHWAHAEVHYWYPEWQIIRDCVAGERAIKERGEDHLPALESMDGGDYEDYLSRATFFNFTGRTVESLTGTLMRRRPVVENLPKRLEKALKKVTRSKQPLHMFATQITREVMQLGRVGILIDMSATQTTEPKPYLAHYTAENIIDWDEEVIEDELTYTRVVLRERRKVDNMASTGNTSTTEETYLPRYRELVLENGVYMQHIYESDDDDAKGDFELNEGNRIDTIVPQRRGATLNRIPFVFIGPRESTPTVEKPPMIDIARLNLSHYRSYSYLEHGRFFTGFPIYYVESPQGGGGDEAEFELGSSKVWVTPPGAKPGLLEMNGQGLKYLSDALDQKESQAASLGGRMIGIRTQAVAESDNALKMTERNEQSVLLQISMAMDSQMTKAVQWWAYFSNVSQAESEKINVEFNKDFLFDAPGAREFRAIHAMYTDGVLPVEVIYEYFKKAFIIPDWMDLDAFKKHLDKVESFPNNPDIEAKQKGYPDAKTMKEAEAAEKARKEAKDNPPNDLPGPNDPPPNNTPQ